MSTPRASTSVRLPWDSKARRSTTSSSRSKPIVGVDAPGRHGCAGFEDACGRRRGPAVSPSRTLDLDLLLYGEVRSAGDGIELPRDDVLSYAFVLAPLAEIAPTVRHPVAQRTFAELWSEFEPTHRMRRIEDAARG